MSDDPIERLDEQREAEIALRLNGGSDPMVFDEAEAASLLRIIRRLRRLIERLARERDDATRALTEIGTVLNAEHTKISGVTEAGLATVNTILHRLGRIVDAALSKTEGKG